MSTSSLGIRPANSPASSIQGCYLVHFDEPYKSGRHPGAQHYVGYANDIDRRIEKHRKLHGRSQGAIVKQLASPSDVSRE